MSCPNSFYIAGVVDRFGEPIEIPCGKCFSCQMDLQNILCNRLFVAWKSHKTSAYVTFTYSDEYLVFEKGFSLPTLVPGHVHKYLDNLKHVLGRYDFEYYLCGEYGDSFNRPHYHALFFGLDYKTFEGYFKKSWKYGTVKVLPIRAEAFRYVSKYVVSGSSNFKDKEYYDVGLVPPFRKMSRGLGLSVYREHIPELEQQGYFWFHGKKIYVNRYYFNKLVMRNQNLINALNREKNKNDKKVMEEAHRWNMTTEQYKHRQAIEREKMISSKKLKKGSMY